MRKFQPSKKNISIERDGNQPSPFVVDLNSRTLQTEIKKTKHNILKEEYYKFFNAGASLEPARDEQGDRKDTHLQKLISNASRFISLFKVIRTMFSWPIILIGKIFYKSCYGVGFLSVSLLRRILFLPKSLVKLVKKIFIKKTFYEKVWASVKSLKTKSPFSKPKARFSFFQIFKKNKKIEFRWHPVATFAVVLLILIIPFKLLSYYKSIDNLKGKVLGATENAINGLFSAGNSAKNLNFKTASENFSQAGTNFLLAQSQLSQINDLLLTLASIAPNKDLRIASQSKNILAAGEAASSLGKNLSLAVDSLLKKGDEQRNIAEILANFNLYGNHSINDAERLNQQLSKINYQDLPEQYQEEFIMMREKSVFLEKSLTEFLDLVENLKILLGVEQDKRYLLIFQNNAELRATGGFFGSFALVDFSKGKIKQIETPGGGSYDTEAGLREKIIAPKPLQMLNPLWHFWDANWWPDWPTSARKIMWFYEKSNGPTVDGVISLTPTVMEEILKVVGPIDMTEKYGVIIDANNFWQVTQKFSEQKEDVTKEPKKIIGDLMNKIIEETPKKYNRQMLFGLVNAAEKSLREKHILLYFKDQTLEQSIEKYGWEGKIKETKKDYLSIINTNIGGGKSDRKIKEKISHESEIMKDGSIVDSLEISRQHTGSKNEEFVGQRNVDWMRIYVPAGSQLIEARGFSDPSQAYFEEPQKTWKTDNQLTDENSASVDNNSGTKIYQESGKTVFANWLMVDPGSTANIYIKYKLPFNVNKNDNTKDLWDKVGNFINSTEKTLLSHSLLVQKQPGAMPSEFISRLKLDDFAGASYKKIWSYPENEDSSNNGWLIRDNLDVDKYWAIILESAN